MLISIDFETRSRVDIEDAGTHRYAMDESTQIICMAYAIGMEEPELWLPGQPFPVTLANLIENPANVFCAWNAQFEIEIWRNCGGRMGWPELPGGRWHDTMGDAALCSYPLALGQAAQALKLDQQKNTDGTRLITKLCKPQKDGIFLKYEDCPDDFQKMYEYCRQDVRTERDAYHALPDHVDGLEAIIQGYTWLSNSRGVPVDFISVEAIQDKLNKHINNLDHFVARFTNGELYSARQRDKMLFHLEMNRKVADRALMLHQIKKDMKMKPGRLFPSRIKGMKLSNLQGDNVQDVLDNWEISKYDRTLLEVYQAINHASVAKFSKILKQLCPDWTVKSNIQYHGAGTGRDAARGFQLQNLPRDTAKNPEPLIKAFKEWTVKNLDQVVSILEAASTLIRPMIRAPHGKKLCVSDYNQVEARGASWTAKESSILQDFVDGVDPYIAQASDMYKVPRNQVDATQRQFGKLSVLACGYQGAHRALTDFAADYGLELERKEAAKIVQMFRKSRPRLVEAWSNFAQASMQAVQSPGRAVFVRDAAPCIFQMDGRHLTMKLPSGRRIWYPESHIEVIEVKYEDAETGLMKTFTTEAVTCMWLSSYTKKWERRGMSGGTLFQNFVQAICRDLLMEGLIRCEEAGYDIVGRVHDELIALVPDDARYTIREMNKLMSELPAWAGGFPLAAEGYEAERYKK